MDYDPRIVDLYDEDNPDGSDHDFYRSFAADAARIVDVGCGTGILTVTLASIQEGSEQSAVVGIDPSPVMLDYARRRHGTENVIWVEGDSSDIPLHNIDLAIMSGNVAQHIPDSDWRRTLTDLRQSMATDGILAFESRNPEARAWESWSTEEKTRRMTRHGELVEWTEITTDDDRVVQMVAHNHFVATILSPRPKHSSSARRRKSSPILSTPVSMLRTSTADGPKSRSMHLLRSWCLWPVRADRLLSQGLRGR